MGHVEWRLAPRTQGPGTSSELPASCVLAARGILRSGVLSFAHHEAFRDVHDDGCWMCWMCVMMAAMAHVSNEIKNVCVCVCVLCVCTCCVQSCVLCQSVASSMLMLR